MQDIVRDSGVPPSWLERKQKVDLQSRSDEKVMSHEDKVGPRVQPDHGISQGQVQKVEENTDGDSDDTIQIKVSRLKTNLPRAHSDPHLVMHVYALLLISC